jgi:hypothetical protein
MITGGFVDWLFIVLSGAGAGAFPHPPMAVTIKYRVAKRVNIFFIAKYLLGLSE